MVAGELRGRIRVRRHLTLEATARVDAVLDVGVLEVMAGAKIRGEVRVRGEEEN